VTRGRPTLAFAILAIVALLAAGCSGGDEGGRATSRAVTPAEAGVLADLLVANHDAGGADLVATVEYGVATVELRGQIDWANHVGRVTMHTEVDGKQVGPDRDVVWNPNVVFEEVPGLEAVMAERGRPGVEWVARPLDPQASTLHLLLQLIDTTSSTTRDNPVLLVSNGVRWLRTDEVDGTPVDVFRNGRTTYWVGQQDDRLHRLDADLAATGSVARLDLTDVGSRTVETPDDPAIVALDEVSDVYDQLVGGAPGQ
jgi:hypothetical protein